MAALSAALLVAGCGSRVVAPATPQANPASAGQPAARPGQPGPGAADASATARPSDYAPSAAPGRSAGAAAAAPRQVTLPPPQTPRNRLELQYQFARRLVDAHPDSSYVSRAPEVLRAIPVLQVELNADGSVRRIEVLRHPSTGDEATKLAIAAVRRAAPYGDVSRLPRPWKVVETFLFNDQMHFKPRILDE